MEEQMLKASVQKKEWVTPELIVLVRNKPEEFVLVACKSSIGAPGGPGGVATNCQLYGEVPGIPGWISCYSDCSDHSAT